MNESQEKEVRMEALRDSGKALAIIAIIAVSTLALFAIPKDNDPEWGKTLLASKAIAAAGFWVCAKLYKRWQKEAK